MIVGPLLVVVVDEEDVVPEDEVVVDDDVVVPPIMPPGIHPPLTQVPPPIEAKGSGVVQPAVDPEVVVTDDVVVVVDVDPLYIDAGTHPPPTHTPPPIETNGSDVVQPLVDPEEVEPDDPELTNEVTVVPTSSRPLLIHASYVDDDPTVRAHTSNECVPRSLDGAVHVKDEDVE